MVKRLVIKREEDNFPSVLSKKTTSNNENQWYPGCWFCGKRKEEILFAIFVTHGISQYWYWYCSEECMNCDILRGNVK